jgi:hypothetical protein
LCDEASPVGGGVGVDPESELVDGYVMVIPTQGYQIFGVVVAAQVLFVDVVDLEPVTAAAAFDRTGPLVTMEDPGPDRRGDRFGEMRHGDGTLFSVGPGDPDPAFA